MSEKTELYRRSRANTDREGRLFVTSEARAMKLPKMAVKKNPSAMPSAV